MAKRYLTRWKYNKGTSIKRAVSECRFEIRGEAATSPVVLGEDHDGALLGAVILETLGLMLNPLTREILPMRMALHHLLSLDYSQSTDGEASLFACAWHADRSEFRLDSRSKHAGMTDSD